MNITKPQNSLSKTQISIIKTLIYFDVFSYPLTLEQIHHFFQDCQIEDSIIDQSLNGLCENNIIYKIGNFYSIHNNQELVNKRIIGNKYAEKVTKKALRNARLIGSFPYVREVCISGSLSKGYMDESGDVDFFIITKSERLWIARTLLILYKKIFLLNSRKYFCVNYFIDENNLEIPDKNIFTATEILTLIPTYQSTFYHQFITKNNWAFDFLPNRIIDKNIQIVHKNTFIKTISEKLLDSKLGEKLDGLFMKLTIKKWKQKFNYMRKEQFELAMRSRKYVSKHHPQSFQEKVLNKITEKVNEFENRHQVKLTNND
ncbi:MAG: nucleotidyltransferase domain-containing protein [Bacteroidia bacterium]